MSDMKENEKIRKLTATKKMDQCLMSITDDLREEGYSEYEIEIAWDEMVKKYFSVGRKK